MNNCMCGRYVGGPYEIGKLYCAFCGEYRKPELGQVVTNPRGKPSCLECGYQIRLRGRYYHRYAKGKHEPKRY